MPRAKAKSSTGLSIELSDDCKFYSPGSKVSGNVVLNTTQDFAIGSVNLEFYGRVKVYFVQSHGQGESHHRGRAPLFSSTSMLYQGFHTHKPGIFSWPFLFEIPASPDVATVHAAKHQWKEKDHFTATDDYMQGHLMPPTFNMRKHGFGYRWHAFTEYVLRVEVKEAQGASMVLPPSARKAMQPILVRDVSSTESKAMPLPFAMRFTVPDQLNEKAGRQSPDMNLPKMQTHTSRHTIKSSRLESWDRKRGSGSALSFSSSVKDRTKSIFNSNSLARYTFDFIISLPEDVRLLQDGAIPINVDAIPVQEEELTTIQPDNYPDIRVDNISLDITAHTYIRFKSIFHANAKAKYDIKLLNRHPVDHTIDVRKSSQLLAEHETDIKPTHPRGTDISTLPGLSLALASAKMGLHTEKPLAQTFNTYIIAREYSFNYKLELDVAGEKVRVTNNEKIPVRVLAPDSDTLTEFFRDVEATQTACEPDHEEAEDNSESDDNEADENDSTNRKEKGILSKVRSRRSKAQEAADEQAANSSTGGAATLHFQSGEALPAYQANPTNFGFRNEIDERPPRYEAD